MAGTVHCRGHHRFAFLGLSRVRSRLLCLAGGWEGGNEGGVVVRGLRDGGEEVEDSGRERGFELENYILQGLQFRFRSKPY